MKVVKTKKPPNRINRIEGEKALEEELIHACFGISAFKEALAACQSPTGINGLLYGCGYQPVQCSLQALG